MIGSNPPIHNVRSRLCHQRLLVHGKRIPKPVEKLENANFCPEVHRELSMLSFGSIHRIQTYGWPHILRGNSFFCVNSPATGKTFAYLPAICSVILEMHDEGLTPEGAGPLAIIICKSSREVQRVASYCKKMLNFSVNRTMVVVEAFGARDIPKVCNLLLNGCAILAATAPAYRRVYENMPNAFVKKRIQTIVIDNIDAIIERFGSELQLLCKNCDKPELQMVVTATYWNPIFFGFLKKYKNMVICIGAYLEAAIYGKSNLVLKLKSHAAKLSEILSFIKENNYQSERILIVCSAASEVYEVVEQLKSQSITHMHCNDLTTLTKMDGFKEWDNQQPGEMHVLVCYDAVVPDLEVNKAQHIIHYSLSKSWTMFTRRFACSFGYYKDPFREESNKPRQSSSSLILLDENNNEQLPKLVEYLRIHNHEVAEPIVKLANNIRIQQEENKLATGNPVDFCSQVLDFGKCRSTGCMKRHVFTTRDLATGDLPTSGIVKVKINNMFSPTHYAVRILEHREYGASDWTTINDAQDFFTLDLEMQQYYANEERHQSHGNVRYNDWCVIYDEYRYWRCRIISIDQRKETTTTSRKVKVKLLDVGRTIDCVSSELLYLTEEFSRLPAQAVDVRIIGVVPHDFETEWDKRVTVTIREWINKYTADDKFHVEGKILLAVRDTIWVDTIRLVEHLGGINAEVHEIHVKSEIVGKVFGVTDKEPLELLKRMVESCEAFKKRANVVEDECVSVEGNETSSESSKSNEFFRNGTKCREVDKPNKTLSSQNSIENSDTESDKYNQTLQSLKSIKCSDTESDKPNNTVSSLKPIECSDTETFKPNKSVSFHKPIEYSDTESDKPDETLQSLKLIKCSDTKLNKPNKTVLSRKPIECSDTESDGCTPHPLNNKKYVPEKVTNIAEEGKQPDVTSESQRKPRLIFEEYDELEDELVHEVYISQYYAPDDFYVCRVEKFSVMTQLIRNFTENTTNLIPLEQAQVGDFCLVFYDNAYQRAKVTRIEGRDIRVFFLDLGGYDTYVSVDLFELPDELLKASAFCAIKAKMACLKPRENEDQGWSPEVGDRIYDEVLACYGTFNSKVIETIRNYATDAIVNCKCYRLLLFDPENMLESWIFDEIVELKLARYIEDERPYAVDVNFGDEEFMKLFDPRYNEEAKPKDDDDFGAKIEEIVDTSTTTSQIETTPKPKARSRLALLKQRLRKKNTVKAITYPKLKCDFRSPKTVWRQDDSLIVIRVSVPENVRYDLKVDYDSLKLCFVHDDDKYLLSIIFFASIVPELTVHEVRGLSILMRLVKFVQTIQWPSLMRHGDRVPWLQQCIEVPNSDETDAYDGMHRTLPTVPNLNVSSDSLSDETEYSDQFDPIEDDYFLKD